MNDSRISIRRTGKFDLKVALLDIRVAATIVHAERGGPVRTIINGRHRKPTGRYASRKARRSLPWEARDERDFFYLCESDTSVVDYLSQPHKLSIRVPDAPDLVYYPDVRRTMACGRIEIVEVKKDLGPGDRFHDPAYAMKLALARQVYEGLGWTFSILTGKQIGAGLSLRNAKVVQRNRFARTNAGDVLRALDVVDAAGGDGPAGRGGRGARASTQGKGDLPFAGRAAGR